MFLSICDRCAHTTRWAARPAGERWGPALAGLALTVALPPGPGHALVASVAVLITLLSGVRPQDYLRIARGPFLFMLAATLPVLVVTPHASSPTLSWAEDGPQRLLDMTSRASCGVALLLFTASTVPMTTLVASLRACRCPAIVTDLMLLIYHQIFLLAETLTATGTAAELRGGSLSVAARWRSASARVATLARRSWERSRRWELGLRARGWESDLHWAPRRSRMDAQAWTTVACATAAMGLLLWGMGPWHR